MKSKALRIVIPIWVVSCIAAVVFISRDGNNAAEVRLEGTWKEDVGESYANDIMVLGPGHSGAVGGRLISWSADTKNFGYSSPGQAMFMEPITTEEGKIVLHAWDTAYRRVN